MKQIADSEFIIMKVLWKQSPLTSRQIIESIKDEINWNDKTVHTLISRLCKKGAVKAIKQENSPFYNYYANINEKDCIKAETKNFIQRMYSGSLKKLVSTFIEDDSVSKDDIRELRELLEQLEKGE